LIKATDLWGVCQSISACLFPAPPGPGYQQRVYQQQPEPAHPLRYTDPIGDAAADLNKIDMCRNKGRQQANDGISPY